MQHTSTTPKSSQALLLIDFQRDFINSNGRMPIARNQVDPVLEAAKKATHDATQAGDFIVKVGNEFRPNDFLLNLLRRHASIAGSDGAKWTERLPIDGAVYFPKWAKSAFVNRELDKWLKANSVDTLVLTGLQATACVSATANDAISMGYSVRILGNAVACVSDASRTRALARLQNKGIVIDQDIR